MGRGTGGGVDLQVALCRRLRGNLNFLFDWCGRSNASCATWLPTAWNTELLPTLFFLVGFLDEAVGAKLRSHMQT